MDIDADTIRRALRAVPAPDNASSLAESPSLSAISITDGRVYFAIQTSPERAPALEGLRQAAEAAVKTVPGVREVLVVLTAERPATTPPATRSIDLPGVRRIIAVASGKGGVGKSTVTANLAVAMARRGLRVGVLDADVYGPSVPILFGVEKRPEQRDGKLIPHEAHGCRVMSIGFLVDADTAMIWRGAMIVKALTQMLRDVSWGELDVLLIDMPPGTGDAQLTLTQHVRLSGAVIVSTPQDLALADARRAIAMFGKVAVPVIGVVENMSVFCCPNCGHETAIFGRGGARREAERIGVVVLGEIPLSPDIRECADAGRPVASSPDTRSGASYTALADAVLERMDDVVARPAPRIVIEH